MSKDIQKDYTASLPYKIEYQDNDGNWYLLITYLTESEAMSYIMNVNPIRPVRILYQDVPITTLLV